MDPVVKANWLTALRSGSYAHGTSMLRRSDDKMCCLGVLCDITDSNGWRALGGYWKHNLGYTTNYDASDTILDHDFRYKIGLGLEHVNVLTAINDRSKSYEEVIKYIEEKL